MCNLLIGKGPSIWDTQCHNGKIDNKDTGDIACDSYHKFREDIKIMSQQKSTVSKGHYAPPNNMVDYTSFPIIVSYVIATGTIMSDMKVRYVI
jgi:hypothetical protein